MSQSYIMRSCDAFLCAVADPVNALLSEAFASGGDFGKTEVSIDKAMSKMRRALVSAALAASAAGSPQLMFCPTCGRSLTGWRVVKRNIVTVQGEGQVALKRYRCTACKTEHKPLELSNGLDESSFTTAAKAFIAEVAAEQVYHKVPDRLADRGISLSAKSVDRFVQQVSQWRKEEEESVVQARFAGEDDQPSASLTLYDWTHWPQEAGFLILIDGGMVRSPDVDENQKCRWFEVRSAIIAPLVGGLTERDYRALLSRCKIVIGGTTDLDELFELINAVIHQRPQACSTNNAAAGCVSPTQKWDVQFLSDAGNGYQTRAKLYLTDPRIVLDIYHGSQHLGQAIRALCGQDSEEALWFAANALRFLKKPKGIQSVIRDLVRRRREREPADAKTFKTALRYLFTHRHHMPYAELEEAGLPIGSGIMESAVKQSTVYRLRRAGMKWVPETAEAMMRLRAAVMSNALRLTVQRRHDRNLSRLDLYFRNPREIILKQAA